MKLLVSDYDGTIKIDSMVRNPYIPNGTISGITDFISAGNMFMIATSRPYDSIISEINKYSIPYDFVSTLNGCIIHDNSGSVIYSKEILNLDLVDLYKLYSCIEKIETIKDNDKVLYYIFRTKLFESSKKLIRDLRKTGFDVQSWFMNTFNIVHPISDKLDSIEHIRKSLNLDDRNVITVGDEIEDLKMLKNYFSYGIIKPVPNVEVLDACSKKVKSLRDAFKDINKNI